MRMIQGHDIDDVYLSILWQKLHKQQLLRRVFYEGSCTREIEFIQFARREDISLFCIEDKNTPLAIVWLNTWEGYTARIHFCGFREAWGEPKSVFLGNAIHRELFSATRADGSPYVITLVGVIPATNVLALKYIEKIGYRRSGIWPGACYIKRLNKHVDAVTSYCNIQTFRESYGNSISKT